MVTPNSLQVRHFFANSPLVQSLSSSIQFEIQNPTLIFFRQGCYWYKTDQETDEIVWDDYYGFAKILQPKE